MTKVIRTGNIQKVAGDLFGVRLTKLEGHVASIHSSALKKIEELEKRISVLEQSDTITIASPKGKK